MDQANDRIIYEGGFRFPKGRRNIFVSYTALSSIITAAKGPVMEATAYLYRRRGREHIRGASINEFGSLDMFGADLLRLPMVREFLSDFAPAFV